MATEVVLTEHLSKTFRVGFFGRKVQAVSDVSFSVHEGEVFGLLGPNGAGKTTIMKMLLGFIRPTAGRAVVAGFEAGSPEARRRFGYLPENHRYPSYLTGRGVLSYFGRLSGMSASLIEERTGTLLEMVNMSKWSGTKVRKYSKGMMQRLGLAQALLNDPKVIFLDEPTDGVDPVGRKEIRDLIGRLREEGKTIFLNSHLLSEVELVSDRVAILNKGEMVRIGTVRELTEQATLYRVEVSESQGERFASAIARFAPREVQESGAVIEASDPPQLNAVIDALRSDGILITSITPMRMTLEQLFIDIVQGGNA